MPSRVSRAASADPRPAEQRPAYGVLRGVAHPQAWSEIFRRLPLRPGDRVLMTGTRADPHGWATTARGFGLDVVCVEVDAGGAALGGLTHLLWWDPSVRAVLVTPVTPASLTEDVGAARRAIDLTGSDALLLVDASAWAGAEGLDLDAWPPELVVADLGPEPAQQESSS